MKLLEATLNVVKSRGEALFIDISRPYAYTMLAQFDDKKFFLKVSQDSEQISVSSLKDLKILSAYTNANSLCIVSSLKGHVLQRGVAYIKDNVTFISLATFKDLLDGRMPYLRLNRGFISAAIDGEKLRRAREEVGMSLGALAEELGVSRETVYRYERGEIEAPLRVAQRLISLFGEDVVKKIEISSKITQEELSSRKIEDGVYRLVDSHPDALKVKDGIRLISHSQDKYEKTVELANALGVEVER
ncbi:MAG: helix-turn-helix domain-containing protein [Pyrobaculum sp.]